MGFWQRWFGKQAMPTGRTGNAKDLEPEADTALIARTVRGIVEMLPLSGLLKHNHQHGHRNSL